MGMLLRTSQGILFNNHIARQTRKVLKMCGICNWADHAGITPRFGEDIFERLKKEKTVQAYDVTVSTGPEGWTLTEEVSLTTA